MNDSAIAYRKEEYDGEIYHMTLICVNNHHVDCVFFKLRGTTNISEGIRSILWAFSLFILIILNLAAKFDGSIGASQFNTSSICPGCTTATTALPTTPYPLGLLDDPAFHWAVIGAGVGIGALLCLIIISCSIWCFLLHRKSRLSVNMVNPFYEAFKEVTSPSPVTIGTVNKEGAAEQNFPVISPL